MKTDIAQIVSRPKDVYFWVNYTYPHADFIVDIFQLHLTLHLSVNGDLLWTLFQRGDVSSNWNLSFLSATKYYIFCPEIFFYLNKQCIP